MSLFDSFRQPTYKEIFGAKPPENHGKFEPITILVTGSQGMIGNAIAVYIAEIQRKNPSKVIQLILASRTWNRNVQQEWLTKSRCKLISNLEIGKITETIDLVIHTASPSNITKFESIHELEYANIQLLRTIVRLNPKKIVYISSGEVYQGNISTEAPISANLEPNTMRSLYPYIKLKTENELFEIATKSSIKIEVIRLFHSFGPGIKEDDGRSFGDIIWGAAKHGEIRLKSAGNQVRTYLYLADAVKAMLKIAVSNNVKYSITNVGSEIPISVLDFAKEVSRISSARLIFEINRDFPHSPFNSLIPNITKINLLGWKQEINLETSVKLTLEWVKSLKI